MDLDRILAPFRARPFRPFSIVTASGQTHLVTTPEHLAVDPESQVLVFIGGGANAIFEVREVIRIVHEESSATVVASPPTSQRIREAHRRRPFRPFVIHTASGESHPVSLPELMCQSGTGDTVHVIDPDRDAATNIDVARITGLTYDIDTRESGPEGTIATPTRPAYPERLWTIEEFGRLISSGLVREGGPEILWDGRILVPPVPGPRECHAESGLLRLLLDRLDRDDWTIRPGHPLVLREGYLPDPDFVVARGPTSTYRARHPGAADVALVVEVADTSYPWDSGEALREYARSGIAQYWIVHIEAGRVEVYRNPHRVGEVFAYDEPALYPLDAAVPLVLTGGPGQPEWQYPAIPVREILLDSPGEIG
jgi:Putative restriction endonuclease